MSSGDAFGFGVAAIVPDFEGFVGFPVDDVVAFEL